MDANAALLPASKLPRHFGRCTRRCASSRAPTSRRRDAAEALVGYGNAYVAGYRSSGGFGSGPPQPADAALVPRADARASSPTGLGSCDGERRLTWARAARARRAGWRWRCRRPGSRKATASRSWRPNVAASCSRRTTACRVGRRARRDQHAPRARRRSTTSCATRARACCVVDPVAARRGRAAADARGVERRRRELGRRVRGTSSPAPATARPRTALVDEDDMISVNYTSGTTGRPKGVMYTHRGAYLNALARGASRAARRALDLPVDAADVPLQRLVLPVGGDRRRRTHVCLREVDPALVWRLLERRGRDPPLRRADRAPDAGLRPGGAARWSGRCW